MKKTLLKLIKKSRVIIGLVLLVQGVTLFLFFLIQLLKNKDWKTATILTSTLSTGIGFACLLTWFLEEKELRENSKKEEEMIANPQGFTIPLDKKATEKEFKHNNI